MPKVSVYNLGALGIDIVNDNFSSLDGSLTQCQNAQSSPDGADKALRKRDGMAKINTDVAAGSIIAVVNIPLT